MNKREYMESILALCEAGVDNWVGCKSRNIKQEGSINSRAGDYEWIKVNIK